MQAASAPPPPGTALHAGHGPHGSSAPTYRYALDPDQPVRFAGSQQRTEYGSREEALADGHDPNTITSVKGPRHRWRFTVSAGIPEYAADLHVRQIRARARPAAGAPGRRGHSVCDVRRLEPRVHAGRAAAHDTAEARHGAAAHQHARRGHHPRRAVRLVAGLPHIPAGGAAVRAAAGARLHCTGVERLALEDGMQWDADGVALVRERGGVQQEVVRLDALAPRKEPVGSSTFIMDEDTWRAADDLAASRAAVAARRAAAEVGASAAAAAKRADAACRQLRAGMPGVAPSQSGSEQRRMQQGAGQTPAAASSGLMPGSAEWVDEWAPRPRAAAGRGRAGGRGRRGGHGIRGASAEPQHQAGQQQAGGIDEGVAEGLPPLPPALAACAWPAVRDSHLPADSDECAICCEGMGAQGPVVQPACRHTLHALCAQQWVAARARFGAAACASWRAPLG